MKVLDLKFKVWLLKTISLQSIVELPRSKHPNGLYLSPWRDFKCILESAEALILSLTWALNLPVIQHQGQSGALHCCSENTDRQTCA